MTNLLDLPLDQFRGYLAEGNYPQARQDELMRAYRAKNSLAGWLDRYGEDAYKGRLGLLDDGNMKVSSYFPVAVPKGMSIWDGLKSGRFQTRFKDYASDALGGVLNALNNPRDSYQGTLPQADFDSAAMASASLPMVAGGVVAGRNAMAYDPNTTNIFAGRRADFTAQPPDKTPGMTSLDDANKMLADGKSNREIYNETGWFQGADGKFRFEIDDKDAKLTLPRWLRNNMLDGETMPFRLDQILDHPEFYKAYPDAARKQVNLSRPDGYSSTMGSYNPYTDVISARIDRPDDDVLSTILHEVQHSTQRREGFSGGANSETSKEQAREFSNVIMSDPKVGSLYDSSDKFSQLSMQLQPLYRADYIDSLDNLVEKARNGSAKPRDITGIQDWYIHGSDIVSKQGAMPRRNGPERDQWIAQAAHYIRREALARDADSVRSVYDEYPSVKDRKNAIRRFERQRDKHRAAHFEYAKVGKSVEDLRGLSSWDAYQREAGETEARNVQTRLELGREGDKRSPAQDGVFPGDTQDFAFTDQVVSNLRRGQPVPSVRSNKLNANASKSAGLLAASLPEPSKAQNAASKLSEQFGVNFDVSNHPTSYGNSTYVSGRIAGPDGTYTDVGFRLSDHATGDKRKATDNFLTIIDGDDVSAESLVAEVQSQFDRALPKMQKMSDGRKTKATAQADALSRWSELSGDERGEIAVKFKEIRPGYANGVPWKNLTKQQRADFAAREGLLAASLPEPRNAGEAMAQRILEMRAAGKAGDVTDEMMAQADPQYMFNNTPLDMSEAARMARAEDAGFMDNPETYHGTGDDIQGFRTSFRPDSEGTMSNVGVYSAYTPGLAETYAPFNGGGIIPLATRKTFDDVTVDAPLANWNAISMDSPVTRNGAPVGPLSEALPNAVDSTGAARTNTIAREAVRDGAGSVKFNGIYDVGAFYKDILRDLPPQDVRTDFYPHNIRSRFARFDPEFSHLSNLSAANASAPVGLLAAQPSTEDELRQYLMQRGLLQ